MTQLARHLPADLDDKFFAAYVEDLTDFTEPEILAAFKSARKDSLFFPKIAELRDFARAYRERTRCWRDTDEILRRPAKPEGWETPSRVEIEELYAKVEVSAQAKAIPSYRENAEKLVAIRNGASTAPTDPAERREWAQKMAAKNDNGKEGVKATPDELMAMVDKCKGTKIVTTE